MAIENNMVVSMEYELKDTKSGEILDSNVGGSALDFIMGRGQIIKGLEERISGMNSGEKAYVVVAPQDAYGVYDEGLVEKVAREQFAGIELEVGMSLYGRTEHGGVMQVIVKEFDESNVMIDYNHPLAGKELGFDITILGAREMTDDDLKAGSCCGGGGHEHECCGGHDEDECCGGEHHDEDGGGCCGKHN